MYILLCMATPNTLDVDKAARLLAAGLSKREVALACGVTTQAIYAAIKRGRLAVLAEGTAA